MKTRIKELRLARDLSLSQVGDYIGVNKTTVKRWEDGGSKAIKMEKLMLLANLFHVTPEYLLMLSDEPGSLRPSTIEAAAEDLTPEEVAEVIDFIAYLKNRRKVR